MIVRRYIMYICHDSRDILYGPWYSRGRDTACSLMFSLLLQRMPNNGPASCKSLGRTRVETVLRKGPIQCRRYFITDTSMSWRWALRLDSSQYWRISVGKCAISAKVATKYCFSIYVHDKTNGVHRVFITSYYSYKTWLLYSVILSLKLTRVLHNRRFFLPFIFKFFCFHVFTVVSKECFSWETIVEHTYPSDGSINRWNSPSVMEQMCKNENSHGDAVATRRWYIMGRTAHTGQKQEAGGTWTHWPLGNAGII